MTRHLHTPRRRRPVVLRLVEPEKPAPVPVVVEHVARLQEWAASGEVVAVASVVVWRDGEVGTFWADSNSWAQLLAGASCLRRRLEDVT